MRQLNSIGYMHNRLRMITACFLVKDLLVNWQRGEKYFMSHLIDGDLPSNNGGWQWVSVFCVYDHTKALLLRSLSDSYKAVLKILKSLECLDRN